MKTNKMLTHVYYILVVSLFSMFSCTEEPIVSETNKVISDKLLKVGFNNYFDWENNYQISMKDEKGNVATKLLPWQPGVNNPGIPQDWYDPYIGEKDISKKKYTKEKGWELVYSNTMEATAFKYIALYNKYTGIIRFFMCIFAEPGGNGSSGSMWGVSVNKQTSLLNFTYDNARGINEKAPSPAYISTPIGSFSNETYQGVGLQNGAWYGLEFVCAYDPSIPISNDYYFTLMGRAINKTISVGAIDTNGTASGTIKGTMPTSSTNLSFSNMFNNSTTIDKSINLSNNSAIDAVGNKIDTGINKGDNFFKGLWNNIKSNASKWITTGLESGAKKGLEAIVSQGGSVVADAIGGLFNSLIGSKNSQVDLKIDTNIKLASTVNIESTTITQGWSDVSIPIPGSTNIASNSPIYNKPLGVWNLSKTPEIIVDCYEHEHAVNNGSGAYTRYGSFYFYRYKLDAGSLMINPEVKSLFDVEEYKAIMLRTDYTNYFMNQLGTPFTMDGNTKYYKIDGGVWGKDHSKWNWTEGSSVWTDFDYVNFNVVVSFNLVLKSNRSIVYSFSRTFKAVNKMSNRYIRQIYNIVPGTYVNRDEYEYDSSKIPNFTCNIEGTLSNYY